MEKSENKDRICVEMLDISDPKSREQLVKKLQEKKMRIDVLVNNAGCCEN